MKDDRFSKLRRYDRDIYKKADITTQELAEKLGISTGTISHLENNCSKGKAPNVTATVLKAYKDEFKCSYEYLMGETEQESSKYMDVATTLPFKMLQTKDIDNLAYIFSDSQYGHIYAALISALLSKPDELKELLLCLLPSFREISFIQKDSHIQKSAKELLIHPVRYTYTNMFAQRIEKHFIPCMKQVFEQYDAEKAEERDSLERFLSSQNLDNLVATTEENENTYIVNAANVKNLIINNVTKDSQ